MTGSIQTKKGFLYAVISYKDEFGKSKYKWISTGLKARGNKKAAKEILARELERFEQELARAKDKIERRSKPKEIDRSAAALPFSTYCSRYIESKKSEISPTVYLTYTSCLKRLRAYFDPRKLRLIDVTHEEIQDFYTYLKNAGLKNKSIKHYANVLRPALRQAYKDKIIPDNPYEFVPHLKMQKPALSFYDKNEMAKFFEVIEGNQYELAFKTAAYYGLRRSELIGLRWQAIDFEHKTIHINHKVIVAARQVDLCDTLKTESSNRTLPLLPAIEKLLLQKKKEIAENQAFYGNTYDQRYLDYVFVDEDGKLIYPDRLTQNFAKIQKKHGLKRIRFHDLRHSCASILLANGVQMKQIQEWLGHSNFATTADVYSHLDFSSKLQSGAVIAGAFDAPEQSGAKNSAQPERDLLKNVMQNMAALGFENVHDYFAYLDSVAEQAENLPDFEME